MQNFFTVRISKLPSALQTGMNQLRYVLTCKLLNSQKATDSMILWDCLEITPNIYRVHQKQLFEGSLILVQLKYYTFSTKLGKNLPK